MFNIVLPSIQPSTAFQCPRLLPRWHLRSPTHCQSSANYLPSHYVQSLHLLSSCLDSVEGHLCNLSHSTTIFYVFVTALMNTTHYRLW